MKPLLVGTPWRPPLHWKLGVSIRKRVRRLGRVLGFIDPNTDQHVRYYGAEFLVKDEGVGAGLILRRFEWGQIQRFLAACKTLRPAAFIDVGANVGTYSCIVGRSGYTDRIFAFEPDPRNVTELMRQLHLNGLEGRTQVFQCAAGSKQGEVHFRLGGCSEGALSRVMDDGGITVPTQRLDDAIPVRSSLIAIKIDVEEYEGEVLKGAVSLLTSNSGYAQIECNPKHEDAIRATMAHYGWRFIGQIDEDQLFEKPLV